MDPDRDLDKCYEVVMKLVDQAGEIIASRNSQRKTVMCKLGETDLLTETDQEVERLLIDGLKAEFPSHKFIGEEQTSEGASSVLTDDPTWVIDPVDGTMNFVHSFPHSCTSIALIVDKVTEIGIIYNPMLKQKFTARRGQGAFYNGQPIHVSGQKELNKALIISEFGTSRDPEKLRVVNANFKHLSERVHGIRVLGAAALNIAMIALGGADACYEMGLHIWDFAAGELLVHEAGGVSMDPAGGPVDNMSRRILVAATQELAEELSKNLEQYYPQPRDG